MYLPRTFAEPDHARIHALVAAHPLGVLVTTAAGLDAEHVPFELDATPAPHAPGGTLRCHVARANPIWRALGAGAEALVVFRGPDTYVTPSWYTSKAEHGEVVPTWNYAVAHAHGTARAVEDRAWLRGLVGRLTATMEAGRPAPWHVEDAPEAFIDELLQAIVGIEIGVARWVGKTKASQNRTPEDRAGVVRGLRAEGDARALASAELVERHLTADRPHNDSR